MRYYWEKLEFPSPLFFVKRPGRSRVFVVWGDEDWLKGFASPWPIKAYRGGFGLSTRF
jgi:hypothetical protein